LPIGWTVSVSGATANPSQSRSNSPLRGYRASATFELANAKSRVMAKGRTKSNREAKKNKTAPEKIQERGHFVSSQAWGGSHQNRLKKGAKLHA
jgi:hypothetical protein